MDHAENNLPTIDRPEILSFIFFPRKDSSNPPCGTEDVIFTMPDGVKIGSRLYLANQKSPTLVYFHGNGEVAADYEFIVPQYTAIGVNLFVMDYRGYGKSGGTPTVRDLINDAVPTFQGAKSFLQDKDFSGPIFVMGRSLGSVPAIELAAALPKEFHGLIIESGFGSMARLLRYIGLSGFSSSSLEPEFPNLSRIRAVRLPTLIIHGENDNLIPRSEAESLYQASPAEEKSMLIINRADHNDIMIRDVRTYFNALKDFVSTHPKDL
jgi:alpha-beta hydrolase superfamily lysophospholipase